MTGGTIENINATQPTVEAPPAESAPGEVDNSLSDLFGTVIQNALQGALNQGGTGDGVESDPPGGTTLAEDRQNDEARDAERRADGGTGVGA